MIVASAGSNEVCRSAMNIFASCASDSPTIETKRRRSHMVKWLCFGRYATQRLFGQYAGHRTDYDQGHLVNTIDQMILHFVSDVKREDTWMQRFGEKVRTLRHKQGLTTRQLANL